MENSTTTIEKLIEKSEAYIKTTTELYKLNMICKVADIFSLLAIKLAISIVVVIFSLMISIGLALWIGESLGKFYYGFFVIAAFYLLLTVILYAFRIKWLKNPANNFIISQSLKEN